MTDPSGDPVAATRISEFAGILAPVGMVDVPVVVGGHAVNLWSEYYLAQGIRELAGYLPFTSKDLDLFGTAALLEQLHRSHRGKLTRSEPRGPVIGRLDVERQEGGPLRVEILHTVKGLDPKDLAMTMDLHIEGVAVRVLMPHMVLKAKIENASSIPQEGRNDVKHVRMMILCVRAFIVEFVGHVRNGGASERALVNLLEETMEIVESPSAKRAAKDWDFDFPQVWPTEALKASGSGKISRWLEHRFT